MEDVAGTVDLVLLLVDAVRAEEGHDVAFLQAEGFEDLHALLGRNGVVLVDTVDIDGARLVLQVKVAVARVGHVGDGALQDIRLVAGFRREEFRDGQALDVGDIPGVLELRAVLVGGLRADDGQVVAVLQAGVREDFLELLGLAALLGNQAVDVGGPGRVGDVEVAVLVTFLDAGDDTRDLVVLGQVVREGIELGAGQDRDVGAGHGAGLGLEAFGGEGDRARTAFAGGHRHLDGRGGVAGSRLEGDPVDVGGEVPGHLVGGDVQVEGLALGGSLIGLEVEGDAGLLGLLVADIVGVHRLRDAVVGAAGRAHRQDVAFADVHLLHVVVDAAGALGLEEAVGVDTQTLDGTVVQVEVVVVLVGDAGHLAGQLVVDAGVHILLEEFGDGQLQDALAELTGLGNRDGAGQALADEGNQGGAVVTGVRRDVDGHGLGLVGGGAGSGAHGDAVNLVEGGRRGDVSRPVLGRNELDNDVAAVLGGLIDTLVRGNLVRGLLEVVGTAGERQERHQAEKE